LRVLHVTPYFAPAFAFGGPPRSILALCRAQQAAGLDIEVLTTNANGNGSLPSRPEGTTFEGVPVRYFPVAGPAMFLWAPMLLRALSQSASNAQVVHTHGLFNATTWQARWAAERARRPLVVSVRGMLEPEARAHNEWRKRGAWWLFDRRVCADASLLHTTSTRETATVRATVPHKAVVEIPNVVNVAVGCADPGERAAMRQRLGIGPQTPYVMFLGRLHPIKRLDLLGRAFAQVAAAHPDVRLVIAGDGDVRVRTQAEAELGPANARTLWLGEVSDRERDALLAEAATLVLCSDSENFGMSVAEALSCGVAPVVTETCPWEILERERAGYWVPQTANAIAGALQQVLRSPEKSREMGQRGPRIVTEHFSAAAIGARWVDEYARLAQ
jgi:glycosyltransferase involved in cell wall biosynthesis